MLEKIEKHAVDDTRKEKHEKQCLIQRDVILQIDMCAPPCSDTVKHGRYEHDADQQIGIHKHSPYSLRIESGGDVVPHIF
jgi:hypothetical protein